MIPKQRATNHQNYHISQTLKNNPSTNIQTHIFCKKYPLQKIKTLKEELAQNQTSFLVHSNYESCEQIIMNSKINAKKAFIILYTQKEGENDNKQFFEKYVNFLIGLDNVKIVSFPKSCKFKKIQCIPQEKELAQACQSYFSSNQGRRIKLSSVHSIKRSTQKNITSSKSMQHVLNMNTGYQKIFYQTEIYNDYDSRINSLGYESVIEMLEEIKGKAQEFKQVKDLQSKQIFKSKKRYLVLTSTNQKSQKTIQSINKKNNNNIDLILLGQLRPNSQYLKENIKLVTNNPIQVITFLKENGFDTPSLQNYHKRNSIQMRSMSSSGYRATVLNLLRQSSEQSSNNINIIGQRNSPKQRQVHHWMVDKQSPTSTKFTTTQILNTQITQELIKDKIINTNILDQKEYQQAQKQSKENEGQNSMVSAESEKAIEMNKAKTKQPTYQQKRVSYNDVVPMNPKVYRHFPSNIITEVSEEYKGSVKQSIMNLQPDLSFKSNRQQYPSNVFNLSLQSAHVDQNNKKGGSSLSSNSQYRNIEKIGSDKKISASSLSNYQYNNIPISNPTIINNLQNSPQVIQGNNIKIYQGGSSSYKNYQSPSKVIRKQLSAPEEVNILSQKASSFQVKSIYEPSTYQSSKQQPILPAKQEKNINPIKQDSTSTTTNHQYIPVSYKAINSNKVSEVISSPSITRQVYSSPIDQLRNINSAYVPPPTNKEAKAVTPTNPTAINWNDYEKIQSDGRTIYRKKVNIQQQKQLVNNSVQPQIKQQLRQYKQTPSLQNPVKDKIFQPQSKSKDQYNLTNNIIKKEESIIKNQKYNMPLKDNFAALPEQSKLQPSFKKNIEEIPSVKVSAPIPKKQQPTKYGQYNTLGKQTKKTGKPDNKNNNKNNTLLNQSNMFSRMSQLHSDGSILRRNNIRFGVKLAPKKAEKEPSMMQSKLVSGIYKANNLAKKNSLNRVISGDEDIEYQKNRLLHINTKFNNFHFIIHQDLSYFNQIIQRHISTKNDKIEMFSGIQQLFQCIRPQKIQQKYDVGFIFVRRQQIKFVNTSLFPDDYFIISIERSQESLIQINENNKIICMSQLKHIFLAQKIIVDSKLYQYVAYRNNKKEIQLLADKFMNTEFILQKIETEFTSQIIDFYYCELPRLARLYLLCDQYELPQLLKLAKIYEEFNPSFNKESCKLICIIGDILKNDELIMNHPNVTFISNPEEIKSYDNILKYAHHTEEDSFKSLPIDHVFCHQKLLQLDRKLQMKFPGRFLIIPYTKVSQVYSKIDKFIKNNGKNKIQHKSYLILHESLSHQKISVEKFAKVFMVGKVKVLQGQIVRILNFQQLFQLLKK